MPDRHHLGLAEGDRVRSVGIGVVEPTVGKAHHDTSRRHRNDALEVAVLRQGWTLRAPPFQPMLAYRSSLAGTPGLPGLAATQVITFR